VRTAGPSLTVVKTTTGTAQSVAVAIDESSWPEVVGTISGDDTIFIATEAVREQRKLRERLRDIFGI
jgi:transcriptional regulator of arginine metabolism